ERNEGAGAGVVVVGESPLGQTVGTIQIYRKLEITAQHLVQIGAERLFLVAGVDRDAFVVHDQSGDIVLGVLRPAAHTGIGLIGQPVAAVQLVFEVEGPSRLECGGNRSRVAEYRQRLVERIEGTGPQLI